MRCPFSAGSLNTCEPPRGAPASGARRRRSCALAAHTTRCHQASPGSVPWASHNAADGRLSAPLQPRWRRQALEIGVPPRVRTVAPRLEHRCQEMTIDGISSQRRSGRACRSRLPPASAGRWRMRSAAQVASHGPRGAGRMRRWRAAASGHGGGGRGRLAVSERRAVACEGSDVGHGILARGASGRGRPCACGGAQAWACCAALAGGQASGGAAPAAIVCGSGERLLGLGADLRRQPPITRMRRTRSCDRSRKHDTQSRHGGESKLQHARAHTQPRLQLTQASTANEAQAGKTARRWQRSRRKSAELLCGRFPRQGARPAPQLRNSAALTSTRAGRKERRQ